MKKPTTSSETSVAKAKTEKTANTDATKKPAKKPVAAAAAKTTTEAPVSAAASKTKPESSVAETKPETLLIVEAPAAASPVAPVSVAEDVKPTPKKPSPKSKPKVAPVAEPEQADLSPEPPMHERIGLTAGSIWHYLAENGATSVTKLAAALPEQKKLSREVLAGWRRKTKLRWQCLARLKP